MTIKTVSLDQIGPELAAWVERQVAEDAALLRRQVAGEVAHRTVAHLAERVRKEARDQGRFMGGWAAEETEDGWEVLNDAPHAGPLEYGRRPMRPGPPLEPIREWVRRKLFRGSNAIEDEEEIERVARAVQRSLHRRGMRPRRFLGDTVDEHWRAWLTQAVRLHITRRRRRR